jgi:hypothetical protein
MKRLQMNSAGVACLSALAALCNPTGAQAVDTGFSLGLGAEYTTGGGDTAIDEVYVPINFLRCRHLRTAHGAVPECASTETVVEGPDGEQVIGEGQ